MIFSINYRKEILILFLAFISQLMFLGVLKYLSSSSGLDYMSLTGDSKAYVLLADNLLSERVFSLSRSEPFFPESFRSPGYPIFLAGLFLMTFGNKAVALFLQGLILSFLPLIVYILLKRISDERVAFWSSIIFIFEPTRLFVSGSFLSDGLFALIFTSSILFFMKYFNSDDFKSLIFSGLLLGASILIRPIAIFLPFIFLIYYLWQKRFSGNGIYRGALCFLAAVVIVISPWMLRNKVIFDSWQISSVGSFNFAYYNSMEFLRYQGAAADPKLIMAADDFRDQIKDHTYLALSNSEKFNEFTFEVIGSDPFGYFKFHVIKTIPFFATDGLRDIARSLQIISDKPLNISSAIINEDWKSLINYLANFNLEAILFFIGTIFWSIVSLLVGLFFIQRAINWRNADFKSIFLFSLIVYFALLTGPVATARYRFPVSAILIFISGNLLFSMAAYILVLFEKGFSDAIK